MDATTRPEPVELDVDGIPPELIGVDRWVTWRYEWRETRWTKVPYRPGSDRKASSTDPTTWGTFAQALAGMDGMAGIGFVLGGGWAGVDLDKALDENGRLKAWAEPLVEALDSYTEVSPSGGGLKVVLRATEPEKGRRQPYGGDGGEVEVYTRGRYFTVTGRHWPGTRRLVAERQAELTELCELVFGSNGQDHSEPAPVAVVSGNDLNDEELLSKARAAKNGASFARLYDRGEWQGTYPSQSEADCALCSLLAFWTGADAARVDGLFRRSALMRPKWERDDYRTDTLTKACAGKVDTYQGGGARVTTDEDPELTGDELTPAQFELLALPATDFGNAEALARFYGDRLRYDHLQQRWFVFAGHRWQGDCDGELLRLCKRLARVRFAAALKLTDEKEREAAIKWARTTEGRRSVEACLHLARAERPIADRGEQWDRDPDVLGVPNGVVNLRTGELRAGRAEDGITLAAAVPYNPQAQCPLWTKFIAEITDDDAYLADYLQRAIGYGATGRMGERSFYLCCGKGSNGKGTLFATVRAVLGDYAADTPFSSFEHQSRATVPSDLAALVGRRFVTASETNEGARFNEARVKAWTGEDPVTCRHLYGAWFTYQPAGKLWFAVNFRPQVADDTEAFWQRAQLVPFNRQWLKEDGARDDDLKEKLLAESEGILAWIVEGAAIWYRAGLQEPPAVASASGAWRREADPLGEWIEASCVQGEGQSAASADLWASYQAWADRAKLPEKERLKQRSLALRLGHRFTKEPVGRQRVMTYLGIGLRGEYGE